MSYSLKDIRDYIRELLNDSTVTHVNTFWSDSVINNSIKTAIIDVATLSLCIQSTESLATTAGTRLVSHSGIRVMYLEDADNEYGLPLAISSDVGRTPVTSGQDPQRWFELVDKIGVDPIPSKVHNLTAYIASSASLPTNDSDTIAVPIQYISPIIYRAVSLLLTVERRTSQAAAMDVLFWVETMYVSGMTTSLIPESFDNYDSYITAMRVMRL